MLTIKRCQHPVGQGFFHSAVLECLDVRLHYVYDCGSENIDSLRREVHKYGNELDSDLGLLFLSHLDNDHVNGLEDLLSLVKVDTVILPYLSIFERVALAVMAVEKGNISFSYIELLADPVGWFTARNTSRIVFVKGAEDGEPMFPVNNELLRYNDQLPPEDKGHSKHSIGIDVAALEPIAHIGEERNSTQILNMPCDTVLPVAVDEMHIGWYFLPFVHPEPKREAAFRHRVAQLWNESNPEQRFPIENGEFPRSISLWLFEILRNKEKREDLVNCYQEIRIDRNLTSMSLYSGPKRDSYRFQYSINNQGVRYGSYNDTLTLGWLGTGDADLLGKRRRRAFIKHYQKVNDLIITMALPHHGSKHNFHADIMPPLADNYLVGAGSLNSYGHPHTSVVDAIIDIDRYFFSINESEKSLVSEAITFY